MKTIERLLWLFPMGLLIGCAAPAQRDPMLSEWQQEGLLPPTGGETSRVYPQPAEYPAMQPNIVVQSSDKTHTPGDLALADVIRRQLQYDRGLAPSLVNVTIAVRDGNVILAGSVKSELDARLIVDKLRDIAGVTQINDSLEIAPDV